MTEVQTEENAELPHEQGTKHLGSKKERSSRGGGRSQKRTVDIVLGSSKGGIGKTMTAVMIAQFRRLTSDRVVCMDTDPENWTFTEFDGLDVEHIDLLVRDGGSEEVRYVVNIAAMDEAMSRIVDDDADFVIDGGAGSFRPLLAYLVNGGLVNMLAANKRVIVHGMLVGGGNLLETAEKLEKLLTRFPETVDKVVWLNPYFGEVAHDGIAFEDSNLYRELSPHISSLIKIPDLDPVTTGACLIRALDARKTFDEIATDEHWNSVSRWRIANIWEGFRRQMEASL